MIVENESNESMGMVMKPNRSMYFSVHETPRLQGWMLSGIIPVYSRLWYRAVSHPARVRGRAYLITLLSKGKSPMASSMTRGKRNILWYQHKTQGANPMTWLKNKLPRVDTAAISQQRKSIVQSALAGCAVFGIEERSMVE
jgi:hypothetical protein